MKPSVMLFAASAIGLVGGAALLATPGAKADPHKDSGQSCFYERNINNYTAPDDRHVYLRVGVGDIYRLDLMNDCPEITFRQSLRFARSASGDICSPLDLQIRYRQTGIDRICQVGDMHKLTASEIAVLPKRDRP